MSFNEKELNELAKKTATNPKLIQRISGSVRIEFQEGRFIDIGLRLGGAAEGKFHTSTVSEIIKKYAASCPQTIAWVARGDFNPSKMPDELSYAKLMHASRTAGRLRAEFIRKLAFLGG